ncbi:MAG: hypothetical protein GY835_04930 [bacterium]|nr:hypothetical protein [bacterium]
MRSHLLSSCFVMLLIVTCGVSSLEQRKISTNQVRHEISADGWPKGLFHGIGDALYWIRFRAGRLFVCSLREGKIERRWIADLEGVPDNLRMTDVTSDSHATLFVLFSSSENFIIKYNLGDPGEFHKVTYSAGGYAHTIRYLAHLDACAVVADQTLALIINEDGSFYRFGPEALHGNNCCIYTTAAVNEKTIALNVNRGLRLFSENHERIIWEESKSGLIAEVASAGKAWAATEISFDGGSAGIRVFLPKDNRYVSSVFPLPEPDDPHSKGDGYWRITDNGNQAVAWSRRSDTLFRISDQIVDKFKLKDTTPLGRVCPAFSESVFLIDKAGYTVISFD